jgi:hypothetical protein
MAVCYVLTGELAVPLQMQYANPHVCTRAGLPPSSLLTVLTCASAYACGRVCGRVCGRALWCSRVRYTVFDPHQHRRERPIL